jgi:hypothetical protein
MLLNYYLDAHEIALYDSPINHRGREEMREVLIKLARERREIRRLRKVIIDTALRGIRVPVNMLGRTLPDVRR